MEIIILALGLIALAVFLFIRHQKQYRLIKDMRSLGLSTVQEVLQTWEEMQLSIGPRSYRHFIELRGNPNTDSPIIGEFSKRPCVYCHSEIRREYEELVTNRDSQGRMRQHWERREEVISDNTNRLNFSLSDNTGAVDISVQGAHFFPIKVLDRFEQGDSQHKIPVSGISIGNRGTRTLGFRYLEEIIPINQPIYVLGEANDRDGTLQVSLPENQDSEAKRFIISAKSEEALTQELESSNKSMLIGAIIAFVIALTIIVFFISQANTQVDF